MLTIDLAIVSSAMVARTERQDGPLRMFAQPEPRKSPLREPGRDKVKPVPRETSLPLRHQKFRASLISSIESIESNYQSGIMG